jgi:hypothetical protein
VNRPPPVPLSRPSPRQWIPRAFPNLPGHSGRPKDPQSPRALVSGELLRRGLYWLEKGTEAGHPIPAVHPRSGGPDLNSPSPILAAYRRSNGPGPLAPPVSPPAPALPAWPRLSARPRPRCPPGPACQPARARAARLAPPVSPPALALPARPRLSAAQTAARSRARPRI